MRVRVRFRVNRETGRVEVFEVADATVGAVASEEHDWDHEQIAHDVAGVLEPFPDVRERVPGTAGVSEADFETGTAQEEQQTEAGPEEEQTG